MTTTDTSLTMPATAKAASRYSGSARHLAALELHAAAEALPTVLDAAAAEQLSRSPQRWSGCWPIEVERHRGRRWPAGCGSPACPPATLDGFDASMPPPVVAASSSMNSPPAALESPPIVCWW